MQDRRQPFSAAASSPPSTAPVSTVVKIASPHARTQRNQKQKEGKSGVGGGGGGGYFKPILKSPLDWEWPTVDAPNADIGTAIADALLSLLRPFGEHKRAADAKRRRRRPQDDGDVAKATTVTCAPLMTLPPIRMACGINSVTKQLERAVNVTAMASDDKVVASATAGVNATTDADAMAVTSTTDATAQGVGVPPPLFIFICRRDLQASRSAHVVDHLPALAHLYPNDAYIVPLPRGYDRRLEESLALRRVSALALCFDADHVAAPAAEESNGCAPWEELVALVTGSLRPVCIPWLGVATMTTVPSVASLACANKTTVPYRPLSVDMLDTSRKKAKTRKQKRGEGVVHEAEHGAVSKKQKKTE